MKSEPEGESVFANLTQPQRRCPEHGTRLDWWGNCEACSYDDEDEEDFYTAFFSDLGDK